MKALEKFPAFSYGKVIVTDGRIILLDEPMSEATQVEMLALRTVDCKPLLFLTDTELAYDLEARLKEILRQDPKALLVFPGNGSLYPLNLSALARSIDFVGVFAQRYWEPGKDPIVMAGLIYSKSYLLLGVKTVVVVDDVISSGLTMEKVLKNNGWRFPVAKWIGLSWVAQVPQTKSKSGVNGYERIETACVVGKSNGARVPVNSLSTLRMDAGIATSYAQRHFESPEDFLRLIRS